MKERMKQIIFEPKWFTVCYLTYLAVNMLVVVNPLAISRVFLALFSLWGACVALNTYILSKNKRAWTHKMMPILLAFLGVCATTEIVQFRYGGLHSLISLCYLALCIVVLYAQSEREKTDYFELLKWVATIVGAVVSVTLLISVGMFITVYMGEVVIRSGMTVHFGVYVNRLFGVFSSPNVGGMYALIAIWCAILNLYLRKGKKGYRWWVGFCVAEVVIAVAYISVALSRGTYLAGFAFLAMFLLVRKPLKMEGNFKVWQHIGVRVVSVVLATAVCAGVLTVANKGLCAAMVGYYESTNQHSDSDDASDEELSDIIDKLQQGFEGREEANNDNIDITNKRMDIWQAHLGLLSGKTLLVGVNHPMKYYEAMTAEGMTFTSQQHRFIAWANGNMHNGFLQILVNCGVVALALMVSFLLLCTCKALRFFFTQFLTAGNGSSYLLFALTLPMVIAMLVNNVVETNFVLMGANFFQAIFWFAAGACVASISRKEVQQV